MRARFEDGLIYVTLEGGNTWKNEYAAVKAARMYFDKETKEWHGAYSCIDTLRLLLGEGAPLFSEYDNKAIDEYFTSLSELRVRPRKQQIKFDISLMNYPPFR